MNSYAQQDQSGAYGSDPSASYAGGYGAANAYPPDPSTQYPAGANPYSQNPGRQQQHPGSEYGGGPQKPAPNQQHHEDGYNPSDNQGLEDEHEPEPEPTKEKDATNGHPAEHAVGKQITPAKKRQVPSEYSQDPHHHDLMKHYAKAAKNGVTTKHLESFVHVASLALAMISHQLGMTEGHEDEEEQEGKEGARK